MIHVSTTSRIQADKGDSGIHRRRKCVGDLDPEGVKLKILK